MKLSTYYHCAKRRAQGTVEYVAAILVALALAYMVKNLLQNDVLKTAIDKIKSLIGQL